jgi:aldehyde dehydrogenase (NAD+)
MTAPALDRTRPGVHLRIGSEQRTSGSGGTHEHVDPTTGKVDAEVPLAGPVEIDAAVDAARDAFAHWRATRPAQRRQLLMRLADLIENNGPEFARRGTLDNGTPFSVVATMVPLAAEWTRYYAGWADKLTGEVTTSYESFGEFSYTLPQPYGVIGMIITWNAPLLSLVMKIPAALAAGNTVVVKPSEMTPFTGELFAALVSEAGIPDGVVNVVPGVVGAGQRLIEHPQVAKISFTGGPDTARKILVSCAERIKPVVLELGGKSANIVFDDADIKAACGLGTFMSVGNLSGQGCVLPTRMIVHESVYDEAVERVAKTAARIPVGDPFDPAMMAGPVVSQAALDRILGMIDRATQDGSRLIAGGGRLDGPLADGFYVQPTVFADVDPQSELAQKEVFGPVLAMTKFATEDEAIAIANATPYGLSGYIQTKDLARAHRVAEAMVTGEVLINGAANLNVHRPFGGFGISGVGKEGGRAGIEEFVRVKSIAIA